MPRGEAVRPAQRRPGTLLALRIRGRTFYIEARGACMLCGLGEYWSRLEDGRPGERFCDVYRYRRERRKDGQGRSRALVTGLGILLILIGAGIGWLPGPGGFLAFLGVALVAAESRSTAHALDWTELRLRGLVRRGRDVWQEGGLMERLLLSAAGLVIVGGTGLAVGTLLARLQ